MNTMNDNAVRLVNPRPCYIDRLISLLLSLPVAIGICCFLWQSAEEGDIPHLFAPLTAVAMWVLLTWTLSWGSMGVRLALYWDIPHPVRLVFGWFTALFTGLLSILLMVKLTSVDLVLWSDVYRAAIGSVTLGLARGFWEWIVPTHHS